MRVEHCLKLNRTEADSLVFPRDQATAMMKTSLTHQRTWLAEMSVDENLDQFKASLKAEMNSIGREKPL